MILFIITWDLLEELGFEHHLYRFASLPPTPYSDLNGYGPFLAPFGWYSLYWGFAALVLVGLSILLWRRGADNAWRARWPSAPAIPRPCSRGDRLRRHRPRPRDPGSSTTPRPERVRAEYRSGGRPSALRTAVSAVSVWTCRGSSPCAPTWTSSRSAERRDSRYLPHPESVRPPLRDLHVSIPGAGPREPLDLPAHDVVLKDDELGYGIYRLREPLEPGEAIEFGFDSRWGIWLRQQRRADRARRQWHLLHEAGLLPGHRLRRSTAARGSRRAAAARTGAVLHVAAIDDLSARRSTPRAPDADRVDFETTVSTTVDQIAVTSGELQREWVESGRRYFHYRTEIPITHHFAYASARYEVTRSEWNGVAIEVYHHPDTTTTSAA